MKDVVSKSASDELTNDSNENHTFLFMPENLNFETSFIILKLIKMQE